MKSNFEFLKKKWKLLYKLSKDAEERTLSEKRTSYVFSRMSLELAIKHLYAKKEILQNKRDYSRLTDYLQDASFKTLSSKGSVTNTIDKIRINGNNAIHWGDIDPNSELNTKYLFKVMKWFYEETSSKKVALSFNSEVLKNDKNSKEYDNQESLNQLVRDTTILMEKEIESYKTEIERLKKEGVKKDETIEAQNKEKEALKKDFERMKKDFEKSKLLIESINNDKKRASQNLDYDKNIYEVGITEQEGLIWGRIFVNFINSGKMHYAVKYFSPDKEGRATERFSIGKGLFQSSKLFSSFTNCHVTKSTIAVLNNDYDTLNLVTESDKSRFGTPSILLTKLLLDIKKQYQFQQGDSEYIENGHYIIEEIEYMSIWTYKCKHKVNSINASSVNGSEAIELLNSGIANYHSKPDFGNFSSIRIYPVIELKKFYDKDNIKGGK